MIALTLPYPPSGNRYWRHTGNRVYRSKEAVQYIAEVQGMCLETRVRPLEGDIAVSVAVYRPRKSRDLDNTIKILLDSLQGFAYRDDSQIVEMHSYRRDDKQNPRVEVVVTMAQGAGQ